MAGMAEPPRRQGGRPMPPPGNRGPPLSRGPPPLPPVDREKTCPLLLRVFTKIGGHHGKEEFQVRGKEPKDEVQIYTWKDATLRELTDLVCISGFPELICILAWVKEVAPAARKRDAVLSFAFAYPDKNGRFVVREVGKTYSNRIGKLDDNKALGEIGFQIGDYLDVAIM
ncbi:Histone deacetylase complex subunit SAP18 [Linum perenne]